MAFVLQSEHYVEEPSGIGWDKREGEREIERGGRGEEPAENIYQQPGKSESRENISSPEEHRRRRRKSAGLAFPSRSCFINDDGLVRY